MSAIRLALIVPVGSWPQSDGSSARPSGSRITTALPVPIPAANAEIHCWYAASVAAPPAEYWLQSRAGMSYATSTGTACWIRAEAIVCWTALRTWSGVPEVNQVASG